MEKRAGSRATASQTSAIPKRNGARQTLPESEDRYRALFDRSLDAVYIHDLAGNFLDANDAALRLLGYSRDEILKLSFADLLDASQLPTALVVLQEIMRNGYQAKPTMFKLKRKDGALVEVETVAAVITNESQPVAIQGIARDITERRRMEEALRKAKEELEHRVAERTAELERRNAELRREVTERKLLEEQLQSAREELEGRVERKLLQKNPYQLTFREFTVLHHVAAGKADKEIAHELGISPLTVHKHVANILGKMHAASRTEAAARALRESLLD